MTSTLHLATMRLLDMTNENDWRRISEETGLHYAWIRQVAKGAIKECGNAKLEKLYMALTDEPCVIVREA